MVSIPLPSHIHYELLLQLLERQTLPALNPASNQHRQVQQVVVYLRKALVQQKQLEDSFTQAHLRVDYRWSLNSYNSTPGVLSSELLSPQNDLSIE